MLKRLSTIMLVIAGFSLAACGSIKSQDYTDAKMEAAIAKARIAGMESAASADARREETINRILERLFIEWQQNEGRRPHRPGA